MFDSVEGGDVPARGMRPIDTIGLAPTPFRGGEIDYFGIRP
jgi:hypothetical protein